MGALDDLEKRATARMVRMNKGDVAIDQDPIDEALAVRQRLAAGEIKTSAAEQAVKAMELESDKLELERRRARVEAMELDERLSEIEDQRRERRRTKKAEGEGGMLEDVFRAMFADNQQSRQMLMQMVTERQTQEHRQDVMVPPTQETLEQRLGEWEKFNQLIVAHAQQLAPSAPTGISDVEGVIRLEEARLKAEIERERLREDARRREAEFEVRMQQARMDMELKQAQLARERERNEKLGGLVEQLGPQAIAAFRETVATRSAPPPEPVRGIPVRCQNPGCGVDFTIQGQESKVTCPACGTVHIRPGAEQPEPEFHENGNGVEPRPHLV